MARSKPNHGQGRTAQESARLALRRQEIFRRWSAGEPQKSIAKSLGLSAATISLDVARCWSDWREAHRGSINEHVELELKRLNLIDLEAQNAWERTKDAKFLDLMIKCGCERRRLLGTDSPARQEIKAEVAHQKFISKAEMFEKVRSGIAQLRAKIRESINADPAQVISK